jgi:hypothetical protein
MKISSMLLWLIAATFAAGAISRATDIAWTNSASGIYSWQNPANWSPNQVPGPGDNVSFSGNNYVEIMTNVTVGNLTLNSAGGIEAVGSVLTVTGMFSFQSGTLVSTIINLLGTGEITGAGWKNLQGATLNNSGYLRWTPGTFNVYIAEAVGGSYLNNLPGGTFDIMSDVSCEYGCGYTTCPYNFWMINNYGRLVKSGGTSSSTLNAVGLWSSGSVELKSGSIFLYGNPYSATGYGNFTQTGGRILLVGGSLYAENISLSNTTVTVAFNANPSQLGATISTHAPFDGQALLSDSLSILLGDLPLPAIGATIPFISFLSSVGSFTNITGLNFANGLSLQPVQTSTNLSFLVTNGPANDRPGMNIIGSSFGDCVVSWPGGFENYTLQSATCLYPSNWQSVTMTQSNRYLYITPSNQVSFYRLTQ